MRPFQTPANPIVTCFLFGHGFMFCPMDDHTPPVRSGAHFQQAKPLVKDGFFCYSVYMRIETIVVGPLAVNCYILYDEHGKGIVVDPGADVNHILNIVENKGIGVEAIVNTHGHFDHTGGNRLLRKETGARLMIHEDDVPFLRSADMDASMFGLSAEPSPEPDRLLRDGDVVRCGTLELEVIHTPGHSPGGICLLLKDHLFSGDTLFAGSIGRTDLPGGSTSQLTESIRRRLFVLDDSTKVYPGHGPTTTIGYEKRNNPFLAEGSFLVED